MTDHPGHAAQRSKNPPSLAVALCALGMVLSAGPAGAAGLLIPMDLGQSDHLRAYGVVFNGLSSHWNLIPALNPLNTTP